VAAVKGRLGGDGRARDPEAVLRARKHPAANLLDVRPRRRGAVLEEVGKVLDKLRLEGGAQAEQVVPDEDLPVAARPRPDADGGDVDGAGDTLGEGHGHALDDQGEAARVGDGDGVFEDGLGGLVGAALHLEAPHRVHALGQKAHVPHHGDAHLYEPVDGVGKLPAALQLHALDGALLHEPPGAAQGLLG
jgi:hypothetical protein